MKELVEMSTEIEVRGLKSYSSILKKILNVQNLMSKNPKIIFFTFRPCDSSYGSRTVFR